MRREWDLTLGEVTVSIIVILEENVLDMLVAPIALMHVSITKNK